MIDTSTRKTSHGIFMAENSDGALAVETRDVYCPFDSLPNELVIEILRLAVRAADNTADPDTRRDIRSSLACEVSSVSRRWKTLALVVPELWSFVYLPKPSLSDGVFDHINVFCARSSPLPMHFDISVHNAEETLPADFILRHHSSRINRLTFRTIRDIPTCLGTTCPFTDLEELHFISLKWVLDMPLRFQAPRLHTLQCIGIVPHVFPGQLQSLYDLTLRDLDVFRITRLFIILTRWANIRRLALHRWTLEAEEPGFEVPLRLMPHLSWLKFERLGQDALRGVLAMVSAPKLETLVVEDVEDPFGGWLAESWYSVALRPLEALTYLRMRNYHKDGPCNLTSILRVAPKLAHLHLSDRHLAAFETIHETDDPNAIAPALKVLEVDGESWPWDAFVRFVTARMKTLQSIRVPSRFVEKLKDALPANETPKVSALEHENEDWVGGPQPPDVAQSCLCFDETWPEACALETHENGYSCRSYIVKS
ncbi:hypothetical protein FRB99_008160 [Tulasnella sp. 403]|nr:hypothetical protein FRB99_008160 [Tulasnella sp. 403]